MGSPGAVPFSLRSFLPSTLAGTQCLLFSSSRLALSFVLPCSILLFSVSFFVLFLLLPSSNPASPGPRPVPVAPRAAPPAYPRELIPLAERAPDVLHPRAPTSVAPRTREPLRRSDPSDRREVSGFVRSVLLSGLDAPSPPLGALFDARYIPGARVARFASSLAGSPDPGPSCQRERKRGGGRPDATGGLSRIVRGAAHLEPVRGGVGMNGLAR